jgi:hypothetical protein
VADTTLRYALQPFAHTSGQVVAAGEVRVSSDSVVTTTPAAWWGTIDNANTDIPKGKWKWVQHRG